MAMYKVEIDGQKFNVQAGSPQEASRAAQRHVDDQDDNAAVNLARSVLGQGLAFNFGDEIEATVRAPFDKRNRKDLLKDIRDEVKEYRRDRPGLALGSEFAGALAPTALAALATVGTGGAAAPALAGSGARLGLMGAKIAANPAARAAGAGALSGAVSGAGIAEDNKLAGAALGGVVGGALGAGAAMLPKLTPQARRMIDEGQTLTPGQATQPMAQKGKGEPRVGTINMIEQHATSLPLVGGLVRSARTRPDAQRFQTVADRALVHVGSRLDRSIKDPQEIVDTVQKTVSNAFDDIARKNPIKQAGAQAFGHAVFDTLEGADPAVINRFRASLNDVLKGLPAPKGNQLRAAFKAATEGGTARLRPVNISGQEMLGVVNKLREKARKARGQNDQLMASYFEDLASNFVIRGASGASVKQALTQARTAYREYAILRDAFSKSAFDQPATAGKLLESRTKNLANPRFGSNKAVREIVPEDTAVNRVLRNTVANSGTPERTATMAGLGLVGSAAVGAVNPTALTAAIPPGVIGAMYASPFSTAALRQAVLAPGRVGQSLGGRFGGYTQMEQ
ncbi:MAG: hypothetical protein L7S55_11915 [Luminiphilus sp.]|nr:hypothetical protein [Luminiphilus sp.]